jgi:SET domain-containing protein
MYNPHSSYLGLGTPLRKFYKEDFSKYFLVDNIENSILDPEIASFVENHDVTKDQQFSAAHIKSSLDLFSPYLEKGFAHDRRLFVALVSPEMGYGVFADVFIPAEAIIGEYTGVITNKSANTDYAWVYFSTPLDQEGNELQLRVDARVSGNMMRFINHSDDPNCYYLHLPFKNRWRTIYVAKRPIHQNEELTVNYGPKYWKFREDKDAKR